MASPFNIFRKRQKQILAVATVVLMFVFVIGTGVDFSGPSGNEPDMTAITTRVGSLTQTELSQLQADRNLANSFVLRLRRAGGMPEMQVAPFGDSNDESLADLYVLSQKADTMGIHVGKESVEEFVRQMTGDKVQSSTINLMLKNELGGITWARVVSALERELKASRARELLFDADKIGETPGMNAGGLPRTSPIPVPPGVRWQMFRQFSQNVNVELMPVTAASVLAEAPKPSPKELEAFFDRYKLRRERKGDIEPGFYQPDRADYQYVRLAFEPYQAQAKSKISDEQVTAYYEANKATQFRYDSMLPDLLEKDPEPPADPEKKPETPDEAQPDSETKKEPETKSEPESKEPAKEEAKEEPAKEETKTEPAKEETKTEPVKDEPATKEESLKSAALLDAQNVLALAQNETPETKATEEKPADDKPAEKSAAEKAGEEKSAADPASKEGTPATQEETPPATPADDPLPKEPIEPWPLEADVTKGPNPEFVPMWRVRSQIEDILARQQAVTDRDAAAKRVLAAMNDLASTADLSSGAPPDLEAIAKKEPGGSVGRTGMATAQEIYDAGGFGRSRTDDNDHYIASMVEENLSKFRPQKGRDMEDNAYIFWRVADQKAYTPKLTDEGIKDKVERVWRLIKAREPMKAKAMTLADEARKQGKPLRELFPDRKVLEPPAFDLRALRQGIDGVESAGPSFVNAVYRLQPGEVGVAINEDQSVAYVVRVKSYHPDTFTMRQMFINQHRSYKYLGDMRERDELYTDLMTHMRKWADIHWTDRGVEIRQ